MTYSIGMNTFLGLGRICRIAAVAALLLPAACASPGGGASVDATSRAANVQGPKDTGSFPNLNIVPQSAAPQFTEAEKNEKLARLKADQALAQASPGNAASAASETAGLNALARNHAGETLGKIEGKCDAALDPNCK